MLTYEIKNGRKARLNIVQIQENEYFRSLLIEIYHTRVKPENNWKKGAWFSDNTSLSFIHWIKTES